MLTNKTIDKFITSHPETYKDIQKEFAANSTIDSNHQIIVEWNYNAYTPILEIGSYNNYNEKDSGCQDIKYSTDHIVKDIVREKHSPLYSIFETNRPNPGIIKSIYLDSMIGKEKTISGQSSTLEIKNIFDINTSSPRLYPMGNESSFKYWSSGRKKAGYSVGTSNSQNYIDFAAPYVIYKNDIWINKISIKTQKHLGYATNFDIDVYIDDTWKTIFTKTSSNLLSDGVLDIYYDSLSNSWDAYINAVDQPDEKTVFDFLAYNNSVSGAIKIKGIRFKATKMSSAYIPLEVIEISPRLVSDITNSVVDFNIDSEMANSAYGLPVGSIASTSGTITISNTDGAFSKNNTYSIICDVLKPNVEVKIYQKVIVDNKTYRFPLKTLYTDIWNEGDNSTVNVSLQDYFKFFKERAAPDLLIANKSGVPTSVAMLTLLDNIGYNNFIFEKTGTDENADKEDVILDFFYSKKEQNVMEVLESLAVSTQTSMYMDESNNLVAMTKERVIAKQKTKDFWLYGNDNSLIKDDITYISNISSFNETFEPPITDINVAYNDIGIAKQPSAALITKSDVNESVKKALEDPSFSLSLADTNFRNSFGILWEASNKKDKTENVLCAAILVQDIPVTGIYDYLNNNNLLTFESKKNKEQLIKFLAEHTTDDIRKRMLIKLDSNYIHTFATSSYKGYIRIDQEIIKYNGIMFLVSNPKYNSYKTKIIFSSEEYNYTKSSLKQGSSLEPLALILDIQTEETQNSLDEEKIDILVTGDGRGINNTEVSEHKGVNTHKSFLEQNPDWKRSGVRLYGVGANIDMLTNNLTVSNKTETFFNNQTMRTTKFLQGYTGNLKLSGPKCKGTVTQNRKYSSTNKNLLPSSDPSENIITGIFKQIKNKNGTKVVVNRFGTRMKLVYDVPKNVSKGDKPINSGMIAGVSWDVSVKKNGITGYFLEVEDVGTINGNQLASANFGNMRLYKITQDNGKYIPTVIAETWVNVSNTSWSGLEQQGQKDGKSQAIIFDLDISITRSNGSNQFDIFWEGQNVMTAVDSKNKITSTSDTKSTIGLFVRGQSSAIFEHLFAYSGAEGIVPRKDDEDDISYFSEIKNDFNRCYLPPGINYRRQTNGKGSYLYFEDFGKLAREVKKFDIRFEDVGLTPKIISLSETSKYYQVSDVNLSNHGGTFWVHNTGNSSIKLDTENGTPLFIIGFPLKERSPGTIKSKEFLEKENYELDINDKYNANRKLYGTQELQLSGQFINDREQAKHLAKWVIDNLSKERKTLSVGVFPNPLLKLGDKIGLLYSDKYYNDESSTYTITGISYSVKNNGPEMTLTLKECI